MYSVPVTTIGLRGDGPNHRLPESERLHVMVTEDTSREPVLSQFVILPEELVTVAGFFMTTLRMLLEPAMPGMTRAHLVKAAVQLSADSSFGSTGELVGVAQLDDWMMQYVRMGLKRFVFYIGGYSKPAAFASRPRQELASELCDAVQSAAGAARVKELLDAGADPQAHSNGQPALNGACRSGGEAVVQLLIRAQSDVNARGSSGTTPLHAAACEGHHTVLKLLLEAGASPQSTDASGRTAADAALENSHPMCVRLLDPAMAEREASTLRDSFQNARLVHVLSTRYCLPLRAAEGAHGRRLCEPKEAAQRVKEALERSDRATRVFNPNQDNAFLETGDAEAANAIWLLNWRKQGLHRAKATGGYCIQILVHGGPSKMQEAEEDMARRGVAAV
jgi:hypothetical protein